MRGQSALYRGDVVHRRFRPRPHTLRYRVFWTLLDLAEVDDVDRKLRLFSHNRFNAVSFHDRDHGDATGGSLREQVMGQLASEGLDEDIGQVFLLCMPRIFGHGFNPLSVYFCYRPDETLAALLYEVHNTFGERHTYVAPVNKADALPFRHECAKTFYVSPFMDMDLTYRFRVTPPSDCVSVAIQACDATGTVLAAALSGRRQTLSDWTLLRLLLSVPLLTLKVIAAIHWDAVKLWWKGVPLRSKPAPFSSS